MNVDELRNEYLRMINEELPRTIKQPVRLNNSFSRVVLDWLCQGVWYDRIARPAYRHLKPDELARCIDRMQKWVSHPEILERDNAKSLEYRSVHSAGKTKNIGPKKFKNRLLFQ